MRRSILVPAFSLSFVVACASAGGTDPETTPPGATGTAAGDGGSSAQGGTSAAGAGPSAGAAGKGGGSVAASGAGGGSGVGGGACGGTIQEGKRLAASLVFVLDYSWSMCQDPSKTSIECANPGSKAKWSVLAGAFAGLIDALPDDTGAGLVYYPDNQASKEAGALCQVKTSPHVPIQLLSVPGQRDALKALPPQMVDDSPVNQTPTAAAAGAMVDHLLATPEAELPGARFLVLITDGKATCGNTSAQLQAALVKGASASPPIKTFVIGVPGSSGYRAELSAAAVAGGTAAEGCSPGGPSYCHFDMTSYTDPAELGPKLSETLDAIRGKAAISCDYEVPAGTEVGLVNVSWQEGQGPAVDVGYDAECKGGGWRYDDPKAPQRIVLCDAVCDAIKASPSPKLSILLGCPTVEIK